MPFDKQCSGRSSYITAGMSVQGRMSTVAAWGSVKWAVLMLNSLLFFQSSWNGSKVWVYCYDTTFCLTDRSGNELKASLKSNRWRWLQALDPLHSQLLHPRRCSGAELQENGRLAQAPINGVFRLCLRSKHAATMTFGIRGWPYMSFDCVLVLFSPSYIIVLSKKMDHCQLFPWMLGVNQLISSIQKGDSKSSACWVITTTDSSLPHSPVLCQVEFPHYSSIFGPFTFFCQSNREAANEANIEFEYLFLKRTAEQ